MKRRDFIKTVIGAVTIAPLVQANQPKRLTELFPDGMLIDGAGNAEPYQLHGLKYVINSNETFYQGLDTWTLTEKIMHSKLTNRPEKQDFT